MWRLEKGGGGGMQQAPPGHVAVLCMVLKADVVGSLAHPQTLFQLTQLEVHSCMRVGVRVRVRVRSDGGGGG